MPPLAFSDRITLPLKRVTRVLENDDATQLVSTPARLIAAHLSNPTAIGVQQVTVTDATVSATTMLLLSVPAGQSVGINLGMNGIYSATGLSVIDQGGAAVNTILTIFYLDS